MSICIHRAIITVSSRIARKMKRSTRSWFVASVRHNPHRNRYIQKVRACASVQIKMFGRDLPVFRHLSIFSSRDRPWPRHAPPAIHICIARIFDSDSALHSSLPLCNRLPIYLYYIYMYTYIYINVYIVVHAYIYRWKRVERILRTSRTSMYRRHMRGRFYSRAETATFFSGDSSDLFVFFRRCCGGGIVRSSALQSRHMQAKAWCRNARWLQQSKKFHII